MTVFSIRNLLESVARINCFNPCKKKTCDSIDLEPVVGVASLLPIEVVKLPDKPTDVTSDSFMWCTMNLLGDSEKNLKLQEDGFYIRSQVPACANIYYACKLRTK